MSADLLGRLSVALDLLKALRAIYPDPDAAHGWLERPNPDPPFDGQPPLELVTRGTDEDRQGGPAPPPGPRQRRLSPTAGNGGVGGLRRARAFGGGRVLASDRRRTFGVFPGAAIGAAGPLAYAAPPFPSLPRNRRTRSVPEWNCREFRSGSIRRAT